MFEPVMFPPKSNKKYEIIEFWGPYTKWDDESDVIIFGPRSVPTPKDSLDYKNSLIEREGYAMHVTDKGGTCKSSPCFVREFVLPNGGEVLLLKKTD